MEIPKSDTRKHENIFVGIQILRAVAAICVALDHIALTFPTLPERGQHTAWLFGSFGVSTFFIISGFLMYETSRFAFGKPWAAAMFLYKRILRIVPLYWLVTSFIVCATLVTHHDLKLINIVKSYLFIPYPGPEGMHPIVGVGWTLNYEMYFYAFFALSLLWPRRYGPAALFAMFGAALILGGMHKSIFDTSDAENAFEFFTSPIISLFIVGCLVSIACFRFRYLIGLPSKFHLPLISAIAIIGFSIASVVTTSGETIFPVSFAQQTTLWAAAVLLVTLCTRKEVLPTDPLNRLLLLLGDASYSIYLSHNTTIHYVLKALGPLHESHPLVTSAILLVAALIVGVVVHLYVEVPLLRTLKARGPSFRIVGVG